MNNRFDRETRTKAVRLYDGAELSNSRHVFGKTMKVYGLRGVRK
jgi:hypothetical protein